MWPKLGFAWYSLSSQLALDCVFSLYHQFFNFLGTFGLYQSNWTKALSVSTISWRILEQNESEGMKSLRLMLSRAAILFFFHFLTRINSDIWLRYYSVLYCSPVLLVLFWTSFPVFLVLFLTSFLVFSSPFWTIFSGKWTIVWYFSANLD